MQHTPLDYFKFSLMINSDKSEKQKLPTENLANRIAVLHSEVKREYFPTEVQYITEKDAKRDAEIIADQIRKLGINTQIFPGDDNLSENLKKHKPDIVFNLVDSVKGNEYLSSAIPGVLEILEMPYTGADILGLALCCNKFLTKKLFQQVGIPVPNFQLFSTPNDQIDPQLRFPLISKLNEIHGAVEITQDSISESEKHLRERLKFLINTYKQSVIVEEFIVGREICAYVLEGIHRKVYLAEKVFTKEEQKYIFATFEDQWLEEENGKSAFYYEKYQSPVLKEYVKKAFDVSKMMDYGKFDIRIDMSERYYFVDANANPAFGPKSLNTAMGNILEDLYKIPFNDILKRLIINTLKGPLVDFNGDSSKSHLEEEKTT